jgi:hypothetical protein
MCLLESVLGCQSFAAAAAAALFLVVVVVFSFLFDEFFGNPFLPAAATYSSCGYPHTRQLRISRLASELRTTQIIRTGYSHANALYYNHFFYKRLVIFLRKRIQLKVYHHFYSLQIQSIPYPISISLSRN